MPELTPLAAAQYQALRPGISPAENTHSTSALAKDFAATLQSGEAAAKSALVGDHDPHSFVSAIAQTELAVEAAVTVRDKVVEAYQEILRMPV